MKPRHTWQLAILAGLAMCSASALEGDVIFNVIPSTGDISGPQGSPIGWGYSLMNTDPSNWFMPTDLNSDSFSNGTPTLLFDFPILAPGGSVTEGFDPVNGIGLFELQWDVTAPVGFVNGGNFVLSGQWWDGDPLNGGNFIADAPDISVPYSATVSGVSSVPEPSNLVLLTTVFGAMMGLLVVRWRRTG